MEGLLALVALFVLGEFILGGALLLEGLFAILAVLAEAVFALFTLKQGKPRKQPPKEQDEPAPARLPQKRRGRRGLAWVKWGAIAVFGLLITAAAVANFVFFEPIARWAVASMEARTGIRTSFASATGNLFTGKIDLRGVTMTRASGPKGGFDITARRIAIDLDMPGVIGSPSMVDSVLISGVEGRIEHRPRPRARRGSGSSGAGEKLRARKSFEVRDLRLEDIRLSLERPGAPATRMVIDRLSSQPMRSRFALFDALFRSNATGSIAGSPFSITTRKIDQGRETAWDVTGVPVDVASRFLTAPPMGWLTEGTMDLRVTDRWRLAESAEIDMDWRIVLKDGRAAVPQTVPAPIRIAARPLVTYINSRDTPLDIGFTLTMNRDQFDGAASLDAAGLWRAAVKGIAAQLAKRKGATENGTASRIDRQVDRFKRFLDRKRKPPAAPE